MLVINIVLILIFKGNNLLAIAVIMNILIVITIVDSISCCRLSSSTTTSNPVPAAAISIIGPAGDLTSQQSGSEDLDDCRSFCSSCSSELLFCSVIAVLPEVAGQPNCERPAVAWIRCC